jgi:hypothetical protein
MQRSYWQLLLGIVLVVLSALLYYIHFICFHDAHHIFLYLLGDLAFIPIEVLFVIVIIQRILSEREKQNLIKKLNMEIGVFFSEVGTELLKLFFCFDQTLSSVRSKLLVTNDWKDKDFSYVIRHFNDFRYKTDSTKGDLRALQLFLLEKRSFLLTLLANPNLLEHNRFTDLLWAVFHLTEELEHRPDLLVLPERDLAHLSIDIQRAYGKLIIEWIIYMKHLKSAYPYLFSLAVRRNPFDANASVIVE